MKKLLIILLSALSLTAFAQQKKVAVYVTGEKTSINKVLGDQLVSAFAKSGRYTAVERTSSFLAELGKEQSYQRTGAVSDKEIASLGYQFGVDFVCVAELSEVFGENYVSARLIDVETAEVVNASNANSPMNSMKDLLSLTSKISSVLMGPTVQEQLAEKARQQAEEEAIIAKKIKELEIKDAELKKQLDKGYLEVGSLLVTWPPIGYELTWESALQTVSTCEVGGWEDWRLANQNEASMICEILKDKYELWNNGDEQKFFKKHSKLFRERDDISNFFKGRSFWIQNNTLFYCTKDRHGYGPRAEYVKGINYITNVIVVRHKQK